MAAGRFRQLRLLLWKNWLFSLRSWKSTLLQLMAPCFFLALATGLSYLPQGLENDSNPAPLTIGTLPKCHSWNGQNCTSLYVIALPAADMSCVKDLVKGFSKVTGLHQGDDVVIFPINITSNKTVVKNTLLNQFSSNKTQAGIAFMQCNTDLDSPKLEYAILFNSSRALKFQQLIFGSPDKPDGRVELALLFDQLFMSHVTGKDVNISVDASTFPRFYQQESIQSKQSNSPMGTLIHYLQSATAATLFIFCAITVQFVMLLYNVVSEKDLKLRQGLKLVGLKDSVYWISWAITGIIIAFLSTCVLMATGYACQLQFFFNTNFAINFILFLLYSISMVPLAFFASVFINTVRAAVNTGMVVFVVGMMVISLLGNPFLLTQLYEYVKPLVYVLSLLPPFHLAKAMADIGSASSSTDMNGLPHVPEHFGWHQLFEERTVRTFDFSNGGTSSSTMSMPRTIISLLGLLLDAILYGVLSWYLDAILQGNHGIPRKFYFFLLPSYWLDWIPHFSDKARFSSNTRSPVISVQAIQEEEEEEEVEGEVGENSSLLRSTPGYNSNSGHALRMNQLRKTFSGWCSKKGSVAPAVDGLSMCAEEHQVLALLGHNGAGKTTTINMLIGLLEPQEGDAYFYNLSVRKDIDMIRSILGVCPQHDVLWGDLTALEHMKLFGNLKNIPAEMMENEIVTLLTEVQLYKVRNNHVKTYSGGMKRRLSVALSFLGNPKVLFLDEPTTGMDPKIRRDIWNLILRMKRNRVTIMTTHSMEEADILGDSIAIMARGQLKVMGTSVNLKNKFAGYKVELIVQHNNILQIVDLVREKLPGATQKAEPIEIEGGGYLLAYALAPDRHDEVVPFFEVIEKNETIADMIMDYSISQTTLEEVFLNVTVSELFNDQTYVPTLMRSGSYTASSPMEHPSLPFPGARAQVSSDSHNVKT